MGERKRVVPEGMLRAAENKYRTIENYNSHHATDPHSRMVLKECLESALRWLSENPTVPTISDLEAMRSGWKDTPEASAEGVVIFLIAEWQRRMFLAPEPEVPRVVNGFDDLLWNRVGMNGPVSEAVQRMELHNRQIVEAWNRAKALYTSHADDDPAAPAAIKDLLYGEDSFESGSDEINERLAEAYQRGQRYPCSCGLQASAECAVHGKAGA